MTDQQSFSVSARPFSTPKIVDVLNYYWIIAGSSTEVYSGATNTLVPVGDPTYVDWAATNVAIPIASEAELAVVLQTYASPLPAWLFEASDTFIQPTPTTYTKGQLAAYAASVRYNHASGGITITSLSPALFLSDPQSRNTVNSAYDYSKANPGQTVQWKMSDGTFIALNDAQLATLMSDMAGFVHACFAEESTLAGSINGGTVTTLAQIDSAFAAISNVFP